MEPLERIHIPLRTAWTMLWRYARMRLGEQCRAVVFIFVYLAAFQVLVLGTTPSHAGRIAFGIGLVVLGLTLFMEGLLLGLMPLGEQVGVQLPRRCKLPLITAFGLLLGLASTLAEPALAVLRTAGQRVTPWEAPLLYRLLENEPQTLLVAVGVGVGLAVAMGMMRFHYGLSIKPFVFVLVPLLLLASLGCALDANLSGILGLAWDAGAVTTGPVTVPLVLALGIGVSRAIGKQDAAADGFGVVMLASLLPVLTVLGLGLALRATTPGPMSEAEFFSAPRRAEALRLVASEDSLRQLAFQRAGSAGRSALHGDTARHRAAVESLGDPAARRTLLGALSLREWYLDRASSRERGWLRGDGSSPVDTTADGGPPIRSVLWQEFGLAGRAVVPLTALLLATLLLLLRDRPRHTDETTLGIGLALVGMALLTAGIRLGLAPLGDEVGRPLPRVFRSDAREERRVVLSPFDPAQAVTVFDNDGEPQRMVFLKEPDGKTQAVPYDPTQYDPATNRYVHVVTRPPLFGPELTVVGIGLVLLFAFGLGFGSTLAEPALNALGRTVEDLTVGTIRRRGVVAAVSVGVGIGLVAGVVRILYDIPTLWLLAPPYLLLLPLTAWSERDFAGIAWDCGGVTTGSITVPLVLAMGLGIGGELRVADGFGVLAMASVYPIITVLLYGFLVRAHQRHNVDIAGDTT